MSNRTCSVDGCDRRHLARGMCSSHYCAWHRETNGRKRADEYFEIVCIMCGKVHRAARKDGKFCSDTCKGRHYSQTMRRKSPLPAGHPVMVLIAEAKAAEAEARRKLREQAKRSTYEWRTARECPGCACMFTPLYTPNAITCSKRCARRVHKRRRRAAEVGASGSWIWSDFMRIAQRFGFRCAYCDEKPEGQLDPDHVVPLSRGGYNSAANLLPACRACNADKRDLLLSEWNLDREKRGLPPRITSWAPEDRRFSHLTQAILVTAA